MLLRGSLKAPSQRFFRFITRREDPEEALKHVIPTGDSLSGQYSPFRFW